MPENAAAAGAGVGVVFFFCVFPGAVIWSISMYSGDFRDAFGLAGADAAGAAGLGTGAGALG